MIFNNIGDGGKKPLNTGLKKEYTNVNDNDVIDNTRWLHLLNDKKASINNVQWDKYYDPNQDFKTWYGNNVTEEHKKWLNQPGVPAWTKKAFGHRLGGLAKEAVYTLQKKINDYNKANNYQLIQKTDGFLGPETLKAYLQYLEHKKASDPTVSVYTDKGTKRVGEYSLMNKGGIFDINSYKINKVK